MTSYYTFCKHALKVIKAASNSRPILKGAYHHPDGFVVVTDSHRLYRFDHSSFDIPEEFTQDLVTGRKIEGNYPDTSRLMNVSTPRVSAILKVSDLENYMKALVHIEAVNGRIGKKAQCQFHRRGSVLKIGDGGKSDKQSWRLETEVELSSEESGEKVGMSVLFQISYLKEALALFKDAGETEITLSLYGSMRPFTLKSEDVTVLLMPIRRY